MKQATRKSDNVQFAVKIIKKNKLKPEELAVVHDEVEIMQKVKRTHFVRIKRIKFNPPWIELELSWNWYLIIFPSSHTIQIDHPHCVKLIDIFDNDKKLYLVLELLTGGELFDRIVSKGNYSEKEAASLVRDVASAIKYLHSINIVHRDLKVTFNV